MLWFQSLWSLQGPCLFFYACGFRFISCKMQWAEVCSCNWPRGLSPGRHVATLLILQPRSLLLLLLLLSRFSCVRLCATPWTAAHQAPLSLGSSRQEHWSGLPLPSPLQPHICHFHVSVCFFVFFFFISYDFCLVLPSDDLANTFILPTEIFKPFVLKVCFFFLICVLSTVQWRYNFRNWKYVQTQPSKCYGSSLGVWPLQFHFI